MAIRVLLDHGVREDRIIFITFLVTPRGVDVLNRLFPKVKIVTGSADPTLTPIWTPGNGDEEGQGVLCIQPGMGHIGATVLCPTASSLRLTWWFQVIDIISVDCLKLTYLWGTCPCFARILSHQEFSHLFCHHIPT